MRRNKRVIRAKTVHVAARLLQCNMSEVFTRAMPDKSGVKVNLNKIPDEVVDFARRVRDDNRRHPADPPPRVLRERYFRVAPHMSAC